MKVDRRVAESSVHPPLALAERACQSIEKFYRLPTFFLAVLGLSLTFVCYRVLPPWQGIPLILTAAFLPLFESILTDLAAEPGSSQPWQHLLQAVRLQGREQLLQIGLDRRQLAVAGLGMCLVATILPFPHFMLFVGNGLFAYWLGMRVWSWTRKYGVFFLVETVYLYAKFSFPRPSYEQHPIFSAIIPSGPYFAFLWFGIEVVAYIKLLDFALWSKSPQDWERYSVGRFVLYLFHPFTFLTGPVIGYEDTFKSYAVKPLNSADLWYAARKCLVGALQVGLLAVWLQDGVLWLRESVRTGQPIALTVDSRLLMWLWLAGMSILLHFIYKGYVDVMLGLSRLVGFAFPEQFWFTLFAKDPVEYWQNGNRAAYKITNYHIFNRFFERQQIALKASFSIAAIGVMHVMMCPDISPSRGRLLAVLFLLNGLLVSIFLQLRRTRLTEWINGWAGEGTAKNAMTVFGMLFTFTLFSFTRSAFLLMVEGISIADWCQYMSWLFVNPTRS